MAEPESFVGNVAFSDFILFLFVIIFTFIVGGALHIIIIRFLKEKTRPAIYKTISKIALYGTYAAGFYFAFAKVINLNVPAGLAALGVLGIAILLPTLPVLQNLAAGMVLSFERPFKEEDIVEINGVMCKVKDVMLRKTSFRAFDGKIITVPNIMFITGTPIINYSKGEFIKVSLMVDIKNHADKDKAIEIIQNICAENPNILPNVPEKRFDRITKLLEMPANFLKIPKNVKALAPRVMVKNVNKDKLSLEVWFWIWDVFKKESIISSFYTKLMAEFEKEKVKFG